MFVILTGASGSGKTAVAEAIATVEPTIDVYRILTGIRNRIGYTLRSAPPCRALHSPVEWQSIISVVRGIDGGCSSRSSPSPFFGGRNRELMADEVYS